MKRCIALTLSLITLALPIHASANWGAFLQGAVDEANREMDCGSRYKRLIGRQNSVISELRDKVYYQEQIILELMQEKKGK